MPFLLSALFAALMANLCFALGVSWIVQASLDNQYYLATVIGCVILILQTVLEIGGFYMLVKILQDELSR